MRTILEGDVGDDVQAWNTFLNGQGYYWLETTDRFMEETTKCTKLWQADHDLKPDGEVGPDTIGKARLDGFEYGLETAGDGTSGPNWPPPPDFPALSYAERAQIFGQFSFRPAGNAGNPEAITITDDWPAKNIVEVEIPQLATVTRVVSKFPFHRLCAQQVQDFFKAVDDAGLLDRILSWGGSWAPRFVRGSRVYLSNHAFGTAFDINVQWNPLGATPALVGKKGSVRELVSIANAHGLFWGGHYSGRKDGMHIEVAKLLGS